MLIRQHNLINAGTRIGLLGGSFNPAHDGHLNISKQALKKLALDQVWWLVSPQNPLKSTEGMALFEQRMASAKKVAQHSPNIKVTDIEHNLGTQYTYDTIAKLKSKFPEIAFVWLMGADSLADMDKWYRWQDIFQQVPIAIFNRKGYSRSALSGKVAKHFADYRIAQEKAKMLAGAKPPLWCFLHIIPKVISSTQLRKKGK